MVPSSSQKSKSILIVDDDSTFSGLLAAALMDEDVKPVVAPKAADATAQINSLPFDLIILDGELPDQNGMSWLAEHRTQVGQTPVMFISASWRDTDSHMRLVKELGVSCVVHKPVSLEVLVDESLRIVRGDAKPTDRAEAGLAELAVTYVGEMTGEFKKISDIIRYGNPFEIANFNWFDVVNTAHKIHGTAGLFEFHQMGKIAGAIERDLKVVAASKTMDEELRNDIISNLDRAAEELVNVKEISERKRAQIKADLKYHERIAGAPARRVLIVDDDTFFLKRIEHLLAAEGILLNAYSDSNRVMDAIEKFQPELVVLDVNMPGINGLDVCKELHQRLPDLPIIIISADSSDATRNKATEYGASAFVPKPIQNRKFISTIKAMLA